MAGTWTGKVMAGEEKMERLLSRYTLTAVMLDAPSSRKHSSSGLLMCVVGQGGGRGVVEWAGRQVRALIDRQLEK